MSTPATTRPDHYTRCTACLTHLDAVLFRYTQAGDNLRLMSLDDPKFDAIDAFRTRLLCDAQAELSKADALGVGSAASFAFMRAVTKDASEVADES